MMTQVSVSERFAQEEARIYDKVHTCLHQHLSAAQRGLILKTREQARAERTAWLEDRLQHARVVDMNPPSDGRFCPSGPPGLLHALVDMMFHAFGCQLNGSCTQRPLYYDDLETGLHFDVFGGELRAREMSIVYGYTHGQLPEWLRSETARAFRRFDMVSRPSFGGQVDVLFMLRAAILYHGPIELTKVGELYLDLQLLRVITHGEFMHAKSKEGGKVLSRAATSSLLDWQQTLVGDLRFVGFDEVEVVVPGKSRSAAASSVNPTMCLLRLK